jgi:hypothetical protein
LVAGGAVAWPYLEPYVSDAAHTVRAYGAEFSDAVAEGLESGAFGDRGDDRSGSGATGEAPIEQQENPLLRQLRGPLAAPAAPPDLSGEVGAEDWAAAVALSTLDATLGAATVDLDGLWEPSAAARELTGTLTRGQADAAVLDRAANQVVVRVSVAVEHAADVLGAPVVAHLLTELTTADLGAPPANGIILRQIDGYFQAAWMVIGDRPTLDAVLTLNADTFGAFGLDRDGRLRPVVDLTFEGGGSYRVPVDSGGVEATVWHELGHAVVSLVQRLHQGQSPGHWAATERSMEAHLKRAVGASAWSDRAYGVSQYGAENVNELVAECFAEYLGSDAPRWFARTVVTEFLGALQQAPEAGVSTWMGG